MLCIYWQLKFPLIIALETNEWHFQRAILKSFNMSPHMTMLGHLSHKLYTVVVGQPVFSILSWGVLLRLFVIVPFITTLINEVWPNLDLFPKVEHFFFQNKLPKFPLECLLWIFDWKWGIWNFSTSNADANRRFCGPALFLFKFLNIFHQYL